MRTTHITAVNQACGDLILTLRELIAEHKKQTDQAERLIPLVEQLQADTDPKLEVGLAKLAPRAMDPKEKMRVVDGIAKSLETP